MENLLMMVILLNGRIQNSIIFKNNTTEINPDNIFTPGIYRYTGNGENDKFPIQDSNGFLIVSGTGIGLSVSQIWIRFNSQIFIRMSWSAGAQTWTPWEQLLAGSAMKWNKLGSLDLTNEIQIIPYNKNNVHEILVSYGTKNSVQAYGGGTIVIAADEIKPCFLPSYEQDLIGIAYIYNHDGKIEARSYSATSPLRVIAWAR